MLAPAQMRGRGLTYTARETSRANSLCPSLEKGHPLCPERIDLYCLTVMFAIVIVAFRFSWAAGYTATE